MSSDITATESYIALVFSAATLWC